MKRLWFILTMLFSASSTSWGQTLQWTKTIKMPSARLELISAQLISKDNANSAVILRWYDYDNLTYSTVLFWFDSKGRTIHSEDLSGQGYIRFHGISSTRLVLAGEPNDSSTTLFTTFTNSGSSVSKTAISAGTEVISDLSNDTYTLGDPIYPTTGDACGFFKFKKGKDNTWTIKRYIF